MAKGLHPVGSKIACRSKWMSLDAKKAGFTLDGGSQSLSVPESHF